MRRTLGVLLLLLLAACEREVVPVLEALPETRSPTGVAAPRVSGPVGGSSSVAQPQISYGTVRSLAVPGASTADAAGDISLEFVDTDVREIVAQVLGNILRVNYTIDPAVRGAATLRTVRPVERSRVLPLLQAALAQSGATVTGDANLYRVVPLAAAAGAPGLAGGAGFAGGAVIPLRYASADDLAKLLQPYAGQSARVVADAGRNALLIAGDPATREALVNLIRAFDVDALAGQSYALVPVDSGNAKDFATAMTEAMRSGSGGALAGLVRVVPMERISAVLVISSQPGYIADARRIFALVERNRRQTVRSWNVYYLQNSRSNDIAYVLQQAFTPNRITAVPSARGAGTTGTRRSAFGGDTRSGFNNGGVGGGAGGGSGLRGGGSLGGGASAAPVDASAAPGGVDPARNPANPLLGGLDPTGSPAAGGGGEGAVEGIRIIPNNENNAVLIYATPQERDTIDAMLRKIDILPLQVRIDATIAEVTLNDTLRYGTQFFFKSGGINGALNFNAAGTAASQLASAFPGFVLGGASNATYALEALQNVTTVKVLSSPQVMVLDNEAARLQVGNLVPYLTSSSQSTLANSAVINSVDYRETGVIMEVIPRVNSGGLVTLDVSQEVSDVDNSAAVATTIGSPTFLQRSVKSRVVVQDGQTVGLAGLIRDRSTRDNSGIPWLKDVPLLGVLAGRQDNSRERTELLVLITPHVIHDQRDARALTEDLRDQLINAAAVPAEMARQSLSGSPDPNRRLRRRLQLER